MKNRQLVLWSICAAIFWLPFFLHFMFNLYWWLFDGNVPIPEKMLASFMAILIGTFVFGIWADTKDLFR